MATPAGKRVLKNPEVNPSPVRQSLKVFLHGGEAAVQKYPLSSPAPGTGLTPEFFNTSKGLDKSRFACIIYVQIANIDQEHTKCRGIGGGGGLEGPDAPGT